MMAVQEISYEWLFAKTLLVMVVIIALAFVTIRYILPGLMKTRRKGGSRIEVLDFQALAARKQIYLVRIEDKKIALAVSEHGVAKLSEWQEKESA